jgi:PTH1 family peptidyl-tRNA hydrolase
MVVDALAKAHHIRVWGFRFHSRIGKGRIAGQEVVLQKPRTFMNLSGSAVAPALRSYHLSPADLLVIHDDLDLPLGRLKITAKGGSAGHKGIASIIQQLGTDQFLRLRLGIGKPESSEDTVDYVLRPFKSGELKQRNEILDRAVEAVEAILSEGVEAAMNRFHKTVNSEQ